MIEVGGKLKRRRVVGKCFGRVDAGLDSYMSDTAVLPRCPLIITNLKIIDGTKN